MPHCPSRNKPHLVAGSHLGIERKKIGDDRRVFRSVVFQIHSVLGDRVFPVQLGDDGNGNAAALLKNRAVSDRSIGIGELLCL